jgi:hypothetical protein
MAAAAAPRESERWWESFGGGRDGKCFRRSAPARLVAHPGNFSARVILEGTFPKIWLFLFSKKGDLMIYQLKI